MSDISGRTRMNLSQNDKGKYQLDITAEYATPGESAAQLEIALDLAAAVIKNKGISQVQVVE